MLISYYVLISRYINDLFFLSKARRNLEIGNLSIFLNPQYSTSHENVVCEDWMKVRVLHNIL
jgi:hypothetical protein